MVQEAPLRKMPSERQEWDGGRLFYILAAFRDRATRSQGEGAAVKLDEFERRH